MQKIFFCLLIVLGTLNINAQNIVHDANAQVRSIGAFNKIRVSSAISLYLSQGNTQAVAVSSEDDRITAKIITEVSNGTLKIYVENGAWNGWNWSNKHLKAYITFTTLQLLDASGASNIELTDPINVADFKLELSGASNMKGAIKGSDVSFEISGASNCKTDVGATLFTISQTGASNFKGSISATKSNFDVSGASVTDVDGTSSDLTVDASGASNFKGENLQAQSCKIQASGASSANINVSQQIDVTASGASSVHYGGSASLTNVDVSGGSTVKKKS